MNFAYSAPMSPVSEQDWVNELLTTSAPLTAANSNVELGPYFYQPQNNNNNNKTHPHSNLINVNNNGGFDSYQDIDSVFSSKDLTGSEYSSNYNSPPFIKAEAPDLNMLNSKLESIIQKSDTLTPKTLESIFDTKDILKEQPLRLFEKPRAATAPVLPKQSKKRPPRKRLTNTQKQAHNKIEKKYRININAKIAGLQQIIPWVAYEKPAFETGCDIKAKREDEVVHCNRLNKSMILEKATEYIIHLQENEQKLNQENMALKQEIIRLGGGVL